MFRAELRTMHPVSQRIQNRQGGRSSLATGAGADESVIVAAQELMMLVDAAGVAVASKVSVGPVFPLLPVMVTFIICSHG
jgi:hypothetical protein